MMYEGEDVNTIDLLSQGETMEKNGVKVIVPVNYSDRREFFTSIKNQLAYFEDVYFDVVYNNYGSIETISNNFKIHREEDFQWSELTSDKNLHICLDNVYYPIDFSKLEISKIGVPIGLRFSLTDGIFPTINRENIRYTKEAKTIIINKIKKVANYFMEKYNESIVETDNIKEIFNYYDSSEKRVILNGVEFEVTSLLSNSDIIMSTPFLKGVELISLSKLANNKHFLLWEYDKKYGIKNSIFREEKNRYNGISFSEINASMYVFSENINNNKREYLKTIVPTSSNWYDKPIIVKKMRKYPLKNKFYPDRSYFGILDLHKHPKSEWRQRIKEFQHVQSLFTDKFIDIDKITIPQAWLDARKKKRALSTTTGRRIKFEGEVIGKKATFLERYVSGKHCKFVPDKFKLNELHKYKGLTVYAGHEDSLNVDNLFHISRVNKMDMRFLTFSNRELKVINDVEIHNLISYEKFMEGKNKPFKRLVTAYLISKLINKYKNVFLKIAAFTTISKSLSEKLEGLLEYKCNYYSNDTDTTYQAMLSIATKYSLFDMEIYDTYLEIRNLLEKLPFIETVTKAMGGSYYHSSYQEELIPVLRDLFKYYKYRIDYTNYKITLNEDLDFEKELTEEVINELTNN